MKGRRPHEGVVARHPAGRHPTGYRSDCHVTPDYEEHHEYRNRDPPQAHLPIKGWCSLQLRSVLSSKRVVVQGREAGPQDVSDQGGGADVATRRDGRP